MKKKFIIKSLILLSFILFSCEHKFPFRLGNNYFLDYNGMYAIDVCSNEEEWFTSGEIKNINVDSTYIILCLKPIYKIHDSIDKKYKNLNLPQQNEIIEKSKTKEYWIINKKAKSLLKHNENGYYKSNVYGPFNFKEFIIKKKELNISDTLKLLPILKFIRLDK